MFLLLRRQSVAATSTTHCLTAVIRVKDQRIHCVDGTANRDQGYVEKSETKFLWCMIWSCVIVLLIASTANMRKGGCNIFLFCGGCIALILRSGVRGSSTSNNSTSCPWLDTVLSHHHSILSNLYSKCPLVQRIGTSPGKQVLFLNSGNDFWPSLSNCTSSH